MNVDIEKLLAIIGEMEVQRRLLTQRIIDLEQATEKDKPDAG